MSTTSFQTGSATESSTIKAVVFDYGKVLCRAPLDEHIERIASVFGYDHKGYWEAFEVHRPGLDAGLITATEYYHRIARDTGMELSPETVSQLCDWDHEMWTFLEHQMIEWTVELRKAGYKTAVLSNASVEFATHVRGQFEWLKNFDVCIFSGELRMAKPDTAIFEHCLQQLEVAPHEALFIDDRPDNIQAARETGIRAIQFESVGQLAEELKAMGFEPRPGELLSFSVDLRG